MKDAIEYLLKQIPIYLITFGQVFTSPKRTIAKLNKDIANLQQALIFFGTSILILYPIGKSITTKTDDFWFDIFKTITTSVIIGLAFVAALMLAWRIVGGKASFQKVLITYCYINGVFSIISIFATLIPLGLLHGLYPNTYNAVIDAFSINAGIFDFSKSADKLAYLKSLPGYRLYDMLTPIMSWAVLVWLFISWGAYREIHGVSKSRSAVAIILFSLLMIVVAVASYSFQEMVFGHQQLPKITVPN